VEGRDVSYSQDLHGEHIGDGVLLPWASLLMALIARFMETERYDINLDCDVVTFMAVTANGSYHAEVPVEGPVTLRRKRQLFKDRAADYMLAGASPCEIDLEEYDA